MGDVAVLASGNGSNFQAIVEHLEKGPHRVSLLICDQPKAKSIERAERYGIPSVVIPYQGKQELAESRILRVLQESGPDLVALAGFMRVLPPALVDAFKDRMVNVHPALLPRFPGLHAIERSYESTDRELGITVHYVDSGVDTGKVIEQRSFARIPAETVERVEERIHDLEHQTYPEVIARLLDASDAHQRKSE